MMRPVFNLDLEQIELIGTFEQVYLDISISEDEIRPKVSKIFFCNSLKFTLCVFYFYLDYFTQRNHKNRFSKSFGMFNSIT